MPALLIALGVAGEVTVRAMVGARKLGVWVGDGIYFTVLGAASLLLAPIAWWSGSRTAAGIVAAGLAASALLLAGTRLFLRAAERWTTLVRQTRELYAERARLPLFAAVVVSILAATGEELFWRGVVQATWASALTPVAGAVLAWGLNVLATLPHRSVPVSVGTAVGAAVWAGLAVATGGVLASIVCHATWTVVMLLLPPPMAVHSEPGTARA